MHSEDVTEISWSHPGLGHLMGASCPLTSSNAAWAHIVAIFSVQSTGVSARHDDGAVIFGMDIVYKSYQPATQAGLGHLRAPIYSHLSSYMLWHTGHHPSVPNSSNKRLKPSGFTAAPLFVCLIYC